MAGCCTATSAARCCWGRTCWQAVWQRLPVTLSLSLYGLVLTLLLGIVRRRAGGAAAEHGGGPDGDGRRHARHLDAVFFFGPLLVLLFAVKLGWLPSGGYVPFMADPWGWLRAATLPAVSLALLQVGLLARITRSTMLEVLRQDYVRTARAKGLPRLERGRQARAGQRDDPDHHRGGHHRSACWSPARW